MDAVAAGGAAGEDGIGQACLISDGGVVGKRNSFSRNLFNPGIVGEIDSPIGGVKDNRSGIIGKNDS